MKIRTDEDFTVLYRDGEPIAAWNREECVLKIEEGLELDDLKMIIQELLSMLHENILGDILHLPENPANIIYRSN